MEKLTPIEWAAKTVKDLNKKKIDKAKKADADVKGHLTQNKQKARGKKIGQY
ncbi:hypothetical protein [Clostridium sp.]|uniref:hypothetical protein n=1 Tax=Clostridium sp. TaxID=1506 RepID=UPI0026137AF1|nr:hypothetical protein [Clostridium sp.]